MDGPRWVASLLETSDDATSPSQIPDSLKQNGGSKPLRFRNGYYNYRNQLRLQNLKMNQVLIPNIVWFNDFLLIFLERIVAYDLNILQC